MIGIVAAAARLDELTGAAVASTQRAAFHWSAMMRGIATGTPPSPESRIEVATTAMAAANDLHKLADAIAESALTVDRICTALGPPPQ